MPAVHAPVRGVLAEREMVLGPGEPSKRTRHWRLARDGGNVAWLLLDREGENANTLSEGVIAELDEMLGEIEATPPRGLVIRSAKPGGFAAGADIRDFRGITEAGEVESRLSRAHEVMDRLAGLSFPTVAVVHGHCLGGGLELALACRHRIAVEGAGFGFPEIMLGLHPGLGGTFRLPALIDPTEAMTMMLTGRTVHAAKARRLGLVDVVVPERHVANAVDAAVAGRTEKENGGWKAGVLSLGPARQLAARQMRSRTAERARKEHYPAPYRLIDLWEDHGGDEKAMQKAEIRSFADLLVGETAQNLIRVFFLREKLKGLGRGESGIRHVHVVGAGTMGGDIAAWCAARGLRVTLADLDPAALGRAVARAARFYDRKLHSSLERRDALDRLIPDLEGTGVAGADLVIEAIAEKVDAKKKLYGAIGPKLKKGAILATNTSSIPLETLREGLAAPERLVGLHFFNPVTRMELVEVVAHDRVSEETMRRARAFCGAIGRLPAPVASAPGFLVNRVLTPYLAEAFLMVDEGIAKETVDKAAEDFGMPMGPIELADRVGLDICLEVARMLAERLREPMPEVPDWLADRVERGDLGRKTGRGLYEYDDDGKPRKKDGVAEPDAAMTDRLVLPLLNTAVRCLRLGVVEDADTLDGAMIFGTGFAPFRGGPIHYARRRGIDAIVAALGELERAHGPRFAPDEGWRSLNDGA